MLARLTFIIAFNREQYAVQILRHDFKGGKRDVVVMGNTYCNHPKEEKGQVDIFHEYL